MLLTVDGCEGRKSHFFFRSTAAGGLSTRMPAAHRIERVTLKKEDVKVEGLGTC